MQHFLLGVQFIDQILLFDVAAGVVPCSGDNVRLLYTQLITQTVHIPARTKFDDGFRFELVFFAMSAGNAQWGCSSCCLPFMWRCAR